VCVITPRVSLTTKSRPEQGINERAMAYARAYVTAQMIRHEYKRIEHDG
jgi:hypothetical protein